MHRAYTLSGTGYSIIFVWNWSIDLHIEFTKYFSINENEYKNLHILNGHQTRNSILNWHKAIHMFKNDYKTRSYK